MSRMNRHIVLILAGAAMTSGVWTPRLLAKPTSNQVRIEYTRPGRVSIGDEVTTVLTFRALTNLDRLEVTLAPFKGLELVSEPKAVFTGLKRGDGPQVTARVRVTEQPFAYLSVTFQTKQGTRTDGGATMVVYGAKDGPQ
jgi:hypothetical protein